MGDTIVNALAGETVVHANALGAVTRNCLVVREGARGAQMVFAIDRVTAMKKVTTTNPGLLVISSGLFTIAAASYVSKQGVEISAVIAAVGALFVMGYVGSRRASVLFLLGNESIESVKGSFREATSMIRAVRHVRGTEL